MPEVYPIGKVQFPEAFDEKLNERAVERISRLPADLRRVLDGCEDLDHHIREGAWSIRALVHHIADSHLHAYVRTKLALTETDPTVKPYDEEAWSRLPDSRLDVTVSLELVAALHVRWVALLTALEPADLQRPWRMPASEPRPLWRLPLTYAWHGEHHVAQIAQARETFGL